MHTEIPADPYTIDYLSHTPVTTYVEVDPRSCAGYPGRYVIKVLACYVLYKKYLTYFITHLL